MDSAQSSQPIQVQPTEVDTEEEELDSAYGDDGSAYTQSLRSTLLESLKENGRGYHKYRDGHYLLPEDESEQDRLDMQHAMFLKTFDEKLFLAPIKGDILNALDLGTGTGIWAIDLADQHPETNVVGVDLSPIQPTYLPPNCKFEVDDFDNDWTFTQKFDLIHGRMLLASSGNFPRFFQQAYDNLAPGGWFEMQDLMIPFPSDDGSDAGTMIEAWNNDFVEACSYMNRDPRYTARYRQWMIDTGFENVEEHLYKWPIGSWAKDKTLKELGAWNLVNMLDGIEGFTLRLFTKMLGRSIEEVQLYLADVRRDCHDRKIHSYWPIHVVYGQKPLK